MKQDSDGPTRRPIDHTWKQEGSPVRSRFSQRTKVECSPVCNRLSEALGRLGVDDGGRPAAFSWELCRGEIVCTLNSEIPIKSGQVRLPVAENSCTENPQLASQSARWEKKFPGSMDYGESRVEHCLAVPFLEAAFLRVPNLRTAEGDR